VVVRLTTPMLRRNMIVVENAEAWPKVRLLRSVTLLRMQAYGRI